jgi:hypothetical protein
VTVGLLIMVFGGLLAILTPVQRAIAWWRWQRTAVIGAMLRSAVPISAQDPALQRLVAEADRAVEQDSLIRGVADVANIYDRA